MARETLERRAPWRKAAIPRGGDAQEAFIAAMRGYSDGAGAAPTPDGSRGVRGVGAAPDGRAGPRGIIPGRGFSDPNNGEKDSYRNQAAAGRRERARKEPRVHDAGNLVGDSEGGKPTGRSYSIPIDIRGRHRRKRASPPRDFLPVSGHRRRLASVARCGGSVSRCGSFRRAYRAGARMTDRIGLKIPPFQHSRRLPWTGTT